MFVFPNRLNGPGEFLTPGLAHIPSRNAPLSPQPDLHGPVGLAPLSYQHAELAHERPGVTLLSHQLTHGPPLHELAWDGLRRQRESSGEASDNNANVSCNCKFWLQNMHAWDMSMFDFLDCELLS